MKLNMKKITFNKWFASAIFGLSTSLIASLSLNLISELIQQTPATTLTHQNDEQVLNWVNWDDTSPKKLIDIFHNPAIANRVLNALKTVNPTKNYSIGVNSYFTKEELANITILNLSGLGLTEIHDVLNPDLIWSALSQINLSNNNFGNYEIIFTKDNMPKLYKILASNAGLTKMINVASYVTDADDSVQTETDYITPKTSGVPRYFVVNNNQIRQIPKYYLKINLAFLNASSNQLGMPTETDPLGVYALPWYSQKTTLNTTNLMTIQDPEIRGPYGIDIYSSNAKKDDGTYKYTEEQVARWRISPFPIKGLTFGNYNDVPNNNKDFDSGVTNATNMTASSGGLQPYFNFANNNLVAPMLFSQTNTSFNSYSTIAPQLKNQSVFVGQEDFKKSKYYKNQVAIKATMSSRNDKNNPNANSELLIPQPDSIFPFMTQNGYYQNLVVDNAVWNRPIFGVYTLRSFNGFGLLEQNQDSRVDNEAGNDWDNAVEKSNSITNSGTTTLESGQGVKWFVPKTSDFGKQRSDGLWNNLWNDSANLFNKFVAGDYSDKKIGFWGTNDSWQNFGDRAMMEWGNPDHQTDALRYKPFRTYPITAKSFAKSNRYVSYNPVFDGNVFYDAIGYENYSGINLNLKPNNVSSFSLNPNQNVDNNAIKIQLGRSIQHFKNFWNVESIIYLHGLSPANWLTAIDQNNSFGQTKGQTTPYFASSNLTSGLYSYTAFYNVVNEIKTSLDQDSSFATEVMNKDDLDLSEYENKLPQSVSKEDILTGKNKFWKSDHQFDEVYVSKLGIDDIDVSYDGEKGEMQYNFRIYTPGYDSKGRLLETGKTADPNNNETPTIDVHVNRKITGFAKAKIQTESSDGQFHDITTGSIANGKHVQVVPLSIKKIVTNVADYSKISASTIAQTFKTSYLGNETIPGFNVAQVELEQGTLKPVQSMWIKDIQKDGANGTIQFKIEIPDYTFTNGQTLAYNQDLKTAIFEWTGLPKATTTYIDDSPGSTGLKFEVTTFENDSTRKALYQKIISNSASAVTAKDVLALNPITTNVSTWSAVNEANVHDYITLYPNNVTGTLLWQAKIPADPTNAIPERLITAVWNGFSTKTTTANWKSQDELSTLLQGKTPDETIAAFKDNPGQFLTLTNPVFNQDIQANDLEFDETDFTKNIALGQLRFTNIKLKTYFFMGAQYEDGVIAGSNSAPIYLTLPISPNYRMQRPVSSVAWADNKTAIQAILDYFKDHQLVRVNLHNPVIKTIDQLLATFNAYDIRKTLIDNQVNLTQIPGLLTLTNLNSNDYATLNLTDHISIDVSKGVLIFENLRFNNWQEDNSLITETHTLPTQTFNVLPLVNTFVWSNKLSDALIVQSIPQIAALFDNAVLAAEQIDALNLGQKTFNESTHALENEYLVDPSKILIDSTKGLLTFQSGAITVTNFILTPNSAPTNYVVTEAKTYDLINKISTSFSQNINISSSQGYKDDYAQFYFGTNFNDLNPSQALDVVQFIADAPQLSNVTTLEAITAIKQWLIAHNQTKISEEDLSQIKALQDFAASDSVGKKVDFSQYFYVPPALGFVSPIINSGVLRTYLVARTIESSKLNPTVLVVRDPFIINFIANGTTSIYSLEDLIYSGFNRSGTTVTFELAINNKQETATAESFFVAFNFLPDYWKNKTTAEMKADLDFLTANRNNLAVRSSSRWQAIQRAWLTTFKSTNVPYDGAFDLTIVYPQEVTISEAEGSLRVSKLLFPYFIEVTANASVQSQQKGIQQNVSQDVAQFWYLPTNAKDTRLEVNSPAENPAFFSLTPSQALATLNLTKGIQTDPQETFRRFVEQKILTLVNDDSSLFGSNIDRPKGLISNISYDDSTGVITLMGVKIEDAWKGAKLVPLLDLANIDLQFVVLSTQVLRNSQTTIKTWLQNHLNTEVGITDLLYLWQQQIHTNQFSVQQFNEMLASNSGFMRLDSPFVDPMTQIQLKPGIDLATAVSINHITGEVVLTNLEIVYPYVNNIKRTTPLTLKPIIFNLGSSFSLRFKQDFETIFQTKKTYYDMKPSEVKTLLAQNPQDLAQYITYPRPEDQRETPIITISSDDVLGTLSFAVQFNEYFENGVNVGSRTFYYNFGNFVATLPIILGVLLSVFGLTTLGLACYLWRRKIAGKDKFMLETIKGIKTA